MRSPAYDPRAGVAARVGLLTAAAAYSWLAGGLRQNTLPATMAVALPGLAAVWLARHRAPREREQAPDGGKGGMVVWALWLSAFLLWEAGAFFAQESPTIHNPDRPTLSVLMEPILVAQPIRALGYLLWLVGGWRLLRR